MSKRLKYFVLIEVIAVVLSLLAAAFVCSPTRDMKDYFTAAGSILGVITLINGLVTPILAREDDKTIRERSELRKTYQELSKVGHGYYGALAVLQTGDWDEDKIANFESQMQTAGGLTMHLNDAQQKIWWAFSQEGVNIADEVKASFHDKASRIQFWKSKAGDFATKLERVSSLSKFE